MKLGIFTTHPIQYHVPLWRVLSKSKNLEVKVFYFSDVSIRGGLDPDFGVKLKWDIPLLEGYEYEFITKDADLSKPGKLLITELDKLFLKEKFDWMLIQGYTYGFERQIIKAKSKFKYRICIRGEFTNMPRDNSIVKKNFKKIYLRWFYKHIDSYCYIGQEAYEHLKSKNIKENILFFSPYAIDDELFQKQIEKFKRMESRQELGIKDNDIALLFSGKFIPRKMPMLLAEAIEMLNKKENVFLIMLGDGELKDEVERKLRPLLNDKLIMPGFVNQSSLGYYFCAADIFILPSNYETWGLVVNEAMQFGLPVIVSDKVGCKKDLVIPCKTGYIFPNNDATELSSMIEKLIENPGLIYTLGQEAKRLISKYSINNAINGILEAIDINE